MHKRRGRSGDNLLPAVPDSTDTIPSIPGPSGICGKRGKADQGGQSKKQKDEISFVEVARPSLMLKGAKMSAKHPDGASAKKSVTQEDLEVMVNTVETTSSSGCENESAIM